MDQKELVLEHLKDEDVINLAKELVRIPSFTTMETPAAKFLAEYMQIHGIETEFQEVEKDRLQVIGRIRGTGVGRSLMLNGHTDIDPIKETWHGKPFTPLIEGNRLYGAGIHNMKGGVAAMVSAAAAIKKAGLKLKGDLIITCVVGELQGGLGTRHLIKSGIKADMAVVPEPYSVRNILTKSAGVAEMAISTVGHSEHISRKQEGIDAIEKMIKAIQALNAMTFSGKRDPDLPDLPRLLVGSIIGGRSREHDLAGPYNVSDFCTILVDVRYPPGMTQEDVKKDVEKTLQRIAREDSQFIYEIEMPAPEKFRVSRVEMPPMDVSKDERIVQIVRENYRFLTGKDVERIGAVPPYSYAGNDTAHLQLAGIPCCLYGPRGDPEETEMHVRIDEMIICSKVLALTAVDVCNMEK
jgi:acetylornithine deacetylase